MKKPLKNLPDTNIIVRYLIKDNIDLYNQAENFFKKVKTGKEKAIILESVIVECVYVLTKTYKVPKDKAVDSLIDILCYRGIVNDDQKELIEALSIFGKHNTDIVDCIIYVKAKHINATLFSFDKRLNKGF